MRVQRKENRREKCYDDKIREQEYKTKRKIGMMITRNEGRIIKRKEAQEE